MDLHTRFKINKPEVVYESFDNEIVAIHFESGNYYSLLGVAADIWALIDAGVPVSSIVESIADRYKGARQDIEHAVHNFVDELQHENLIAVRNTQQPEPAGRGPVQPNPSPTLDFQPPQLEKFSDMQDLLLLDPIHDVDEAGWPSAQTDAPVPGE